MTLEKAWLVKLTDDRGSFKKVNTIAEADGLFFQCPRCHHSAINSRITERILCWFKHVPLTIAPKPARFVPTGHDLKDISFVSQNITGCRWHKFIQIRDGEATIS